MVRLWTNLCQPCFFHMKSFLTYKCTTYAYTPPYSCSAPLLVPLGYTVIFDCQNNSFSNVIYQVRQLSVMLSSEIVWYLFAYMNSLLDSFTYPFGIQWGMFVDTLPYKYYGHVFIMQPNRYVAVWKAVVAKRFSIELVSIPVCVSGPALSQ